MSIKLALRNVRRQLGNYLIYFITVSLTVALMFAVNNVIFEGQLSALADTFEGLRAGLIAVTVAVSLIVAFVLAYAASFMLRLRKREFGTYLTLGMTRRNVLGIFLTESLMLYAVSLCCGIVLGLGVYQGLTAVIVRITETDFAAAGYSLRGLWLTVGLVTGVFLFSSVASVAYLRHVRIYRLLHDEEKPERASKHPVVWASITAVALAGIVISCVLFSRSLAATMNGKSGNALLLWLVVLGASIVLFHTGAAKSIVNLLLRSKAICARGTDTFVLRQLSGKLNADSVLMGALAFLIAFAMIGANVSFAQQASAREQLDRNYPFDIVVEHNADDRPHLTFAEGEEILARYVNAADREEYTVYTTQESYLYGFTAWSGEGYAGLYDSFMTESDCNRLYARLGYAPIDLQGGFKLTADPYVRRYDFSAVTLSYGNKTLPFCGFDERPAFTDGYMLAVVPDDFVTGLSVSSVGRVYFTGRAKYDAAALCKELTYETSAGSWQIERCDYRLRELGRLELMAQNAVIIVAALYIAAVFVFLAMAILALKTLSALARDKRRYETLFRLGVSRRMQSRTYFKQIFLFFFLPFALPVLLSVPAAIICSQIMTLAGLTATAKASYAIAAVIAAVLTGIYALYFTATYLLAERRVVRAR